MRIRQRAFYFRFRARLFVANIPNRLYRFRAQFSRILPRISLRAPGHVGVQFQKSRASLHSEVYQMRKFTFSRRVVVKNVWFIKKKEREKREKGHDICRILSCRMIVESNIDTRYMCFISAFRQLFEYYSS